MTASTTPKPEPPSPGVKQPASLTREAGPAMAYVPAVQGNDWLRPAVVLGALALLLAAFHGVRQEIKDVRQEIKDVRQEINGVRQEVTGVRQEINGVRQEVRASEESLRGDLKSDIAELKADYRALNEKLDRVLESLR